MNGSNLEAQFMTLWHLLKAVEGGQRDVQELVRMYGVSLDNALTLDLAYFNSRGVLYLSDEGHQALLPFGSSEED